MVDDKIVNCTGLGCNFCNFIALLESLFYFLLSITFAVAVFFLIIYGFLYLFSFARFRNIKSVKKGVKWSLVGFSICLLAWLIIHAIFLIFGYKKDGSWWKIECIAPPKISIDPSLNLKKNPDQIQYANEVLLNNFGGRNNPINLKDFQAQNLLDIPKDKYFFLHGLGGQAPEKTAKQLLELINITSQNNMSIYTVVPKKISDSGEIDYSQVINLSNYLSSNTNQSISNIKKLVNQIATDSPTMEIPFYLSKTGAAPTKFNNIWPKNIYQKPQEAISSITKEGVVYEENKIVSTVDELKDDLSYVTFNFSYSPEKDTYYLNKDNPVTFDFPANISPETAKKTAALISEAVANNLSNKSYSNDSLIGITNLIAKDIQKENSPNIEEDSIYSTGILPSGLIKNTSGSVSDINSFNQKMGSYAKKLIDLEAPTLPQIPGTDTSNFFPKPPSIRDLTLSEIDNMIPTTEQESITGAIGENVSAVKNYDISQLKYRVSTSRILNLEEREKIRKMLEGLRSEVAENGTDMNIPIDFLMCIFQKESKFDAGALSPTKCAGIGQISMASSQDALKQMEKYAPKYFKEFQEKFKSKGMGDIKKVFTGSNFDKRRQYLRMDPNFCAAMSYMLLDFKKRGNNKSAKPVANDNDLIYLAHKYGPGKIKKPKYASEVMQCFQNNAWKEILKW